MNYVKNVYDLAEKILEDPQHVSLNELKIREYSKFLQTINRPEPFKYFRDIETEILIELVTTSVDYCFWYGKSTIRPNGSSCSLLYKLVNDVFFQPYQSLKSCLEKVIETLTIMRFPLLENRIRHLKELEPKAEEFVSYVVSHYGKVSLNDMISKLICSFPGFAEDLFLKRACLFFIQLYRKHRWFKNEVKSFLIPADYQLPRVMLSYGLISYSSSLRDMIFSHQLIPKCSSQEVEIRAATVLVAKKISEYSGWNIADIDTILFEQRKLVNTPFHLTITADY